MPRPVLAPIVLLGCSFIPHAYSQVATPLPSAEAILDRFVTVSGGQSAYDRVENDVRIITATVSGTAVAQIVAYRNKSGELHQIVRGAGGANELGVKDGVVWTRNGDNAHILETGEERAQALQAAELLSDGHWRKVYKSAETVGTETLKGSLCYVLKVVPMTGEPHTLWYDANTGLQAKEVSPLAAGGKGEVVAQEYFVTGGIKMPRVYEMRMNGAAIIMTVDEVKFNQLIPDSIFALPADIERLMKKRYQAK